MSNELEDLIKDSEQKLYNNQTDQNDLFIDNQNQLSAPFVIMTNENASDFNNIKKQINED